MTKEININNNKTTPPPPPTTEYVRKSTEVHVNVEKDSNKKQK